MKENILIDKSIDFGARIVKLHKYLVTEKCESVISKQILRSGTSIGANITMNWKNRNQLSIYNDVSKNLNIHYSYDNNSFLC